MVLTVPTCEPKAVTAGSSWQWDKTLPDYLPSDGWTLKYALRGPSVLDLAADTSELGDYFEVRTLPAATAALAPGRYRLLAYVDNGTDQFDILAGTIVVNPDIRAMAEGDGESENEQVLTLIKARISGRLPADRENFQINGTAITRIPIEQLVQLQRVYELRVLFERDPNAKVSHRVAFR